jgi:hypothetical protein
VAELPIACSLTGSELRERRETVLASIRARVQEVREIEAGIALRFDPGGDVLTALAELIELERQCCPFLQFDLRVLPANGPLWLELTGPDGTREFLRDVLEIPRS